MFFLFSKLLSIFLSPFTWILILIIFSVFIKKANKKRNFLIFAIVLLIVFSNQFILNTVYKHWETPPVSLDKIKTHDYAIVLGGFSSYDTTYKKLKLTEAGDRIWQTMQLYYQKKARKIFISGGSGKLLRQDLTEADKVKQVLILMHIPEKDIIIDPVSRNTHENALNTAGWLKKHDPKATCILITSASHMPRALKCFQKQGLSVFPYSSNWNYDVNNLSLDVLLIPSVDVLKGWDVLLKELSGYIIYKVIGYI